MTRTIEALGVVPSRQIVEPGSNGDDVELSTVIGRVGADSTGCQSWLMVTKPTRSVY